MHTVQAQIVYKRLLRSLEVEKRQIDYTIKAYYINCILEEIGFNSQVEIQLVALFPRNKFTSKLYVSFEYF